MMTAVCPCWMASPLSVAQLIHQDVKFDYVIFDEASQILPEDAIPAIMRGKYVIVAGDNKALLRPVSSLLESRMTRAKAPRLASRVSRHDASLRSKLPSELHYRSRDEALIAFSNHWMYDDKLVTFPGVGARLPSRIVW